MRAMASQAQTIYLFIQQIVQANNKECINASHYYPFVRESTSNTENITMARRRQAQALL